MFDIIKCEVEETKDHWDLEFQTKDLENLMIHYELNHKGLFQLTTSIWDDETLDKPKRIKYTGTIEFYASDKDKNWIEYWALLDNGKVLWIKRKPEKNVRNHSKK